MADQTERMTSEEYLALLRGPRTPKSSARGKGRVTGTTTWHHSPVVGLIRCRSKVEARRAGELDLMFKGGEILAWWFESPLPCGMKNDDGTPVRMFPDFKILWPDGRFTYEDTKPKGVKPERDWTLRRKAVRSHLGIDVEVIT